MDYIIIVILFVVAFILALRSTSDMGYGKVIEGHIEKKKAKSSIIFLKDKVVHYSSASSSPSL